MKRKEIGSEPGIFDKEYWQEDPGPEFGRFLNCIVIVMVTGTILYLAIAYLVVY